MKTRNNSGARQCPYELQIKHLPERMRCLLALLVFCSLEMVGSVVVCHLLLHRNSVYATNPNVVHCGMVLKITTILHMHLPGPSQIEGYKNPCIVSWVSQECLDLKPCW